MSETASSPSFPPATPRERSAIPERHRWNLLDIFSDWAAWERGCADLSAAVDRFSSLQGTLARGPERLLDVLQTMDAAGQLAYRV